MNKHAFSLLEVILASAIFVIFASGAIVAILGGLNLNRLGSEYSIANQYAAEGIEATRSIKNQAFANLVNTAGTGVTKTGGVWTFSGANNVSDKFTRVISIADVYRDGSGNIVASGGTLDTSSKKATSTVSWNFAPGKNNSIDSISYFTNWKAPFGKGGLLAFSNGGTTSDVMLYKTMDATGVWSSNGSLADIDGSTTNKYARAIKVYASATRNEKIVVSRHYNGTTQWIYAQVFNGSTWGNVVQLSTWNSTARLDVQNFDGTYLANGDFMTVYSDNSTTPKFRTWNGSSWSAQVSMRALSGAPYNIVLRNRSMSNEVMFVSIDSASDTSSEYFNGGAYATKSWTTALDHGTNTPTSTKRIVDFQWSLNSPLSGAIIYSNSSTDKFIRAKIFSSNGSGGGVWGKQSNVVGQTYMVGAMQLTARPYANEYLACNKDGGSTPRITCYKLTFSGTTATMASVTNGIIASATDTGIQASFAVQYSTDGSSALITYGDGTNVVKYKLYSPSTSSFSASATAISTTPYTLGTPVRTVREILDVNGSTIMTLFTDNNRDLYSTSCAGSFSPVSQHSINGSETTDFWYDFAWDLF